MRRHIIIGILIVCCLLVSCGKENCTVEGCKETVYKDGLCPDHFVEASLVEAEPSIDKNNAIQISVDGLNSAISQNEARANGYIDGKTYLISGIVAEVYADYAVILGKGNENTKVKTFTVPGYGKGLEWEFAVYVSATSEELAKLNPGSNCSFYGIFDECGINDWGERADQLYLKLDYAESK